MAPEVEIISTLQLLLIWLLNWIRVLVVAGLGYNCMSFPSMASKATVRTGEYFAVPSFSICFSLNMIC